MIDPQWQELDNLIKDIRGDVTKFDSGNGSAGTRVRKAMMAVKAKAQEIRNAVTQTKASAK